MSTVVVVSGSFRHSTNRNCRLCVLLLVYCIRLPVKFIYRHRFNLDMYCTIRILNIVDKFKYFASNGSHVTTWNLAERRSAPCPCVSFEGCRRDMSDCGVAVWFHSAICFISSTWERHTQVGTVANRQKHEKHQSYRAKKVNVPSQTHSLEGETHQQTLKLVGGFKDFYFHPCLGEMIQFDDMIFFKGVGSTTNQKNHDVMFTLVSLAASGRFGTSKVSIFGYL